MLKSANKNSHALSFCSHDKEICPYLKHNCLGYIHKSFIHGTSVPKAWLDPCHIVWPRGAGNNSKVRMYISFFCKRNKLLFKFRPYRGRTCVDSAECQIKFPWNLIFTWPLFAYHNLHITYNIKTPFTSSVPLPLRLFLIKS